MTIAEATARDSRSIQGRNARLYGEPASECPCSEGCEDRAAWKQAYAAAAASIPPGKS